MVIYRFWNWFFIPSCILLLLTSAIAQHSATAAPNCGVRSVINLSQFLGREIEQRQFDELCQRYPTEQVSMLDVKNAAESLGIRLAGQQISLDQLQQRRQPVIAAVTNHFVMVDQVSDKWVRVFEDAGPSLMPRAEFERGYSGKALVLAENNTSLVQGVLVVDQPITDLGEIPLNSAPIKVTVNLRNVGQKPVTLQRIIPTCNCTSSPKFASVIAPNQTVPLEMNVDLPASGSIHAGVVIYSDASQPVQHISIVGVIENDVVIDPSRLYLGEVPAGREIQRTVTIRDKDKKLPQPLSVSTSSKHVEATLTQEENAETHEVKIVLRDTFPSGLVDETVVIAGPDKSQRVITIPLKGNVASDIVLNPRQLFLGRIKSGSNMRKTIIAQSRSKSPFNIKSTQVKDARISVKASPDVTAAAHAVEINIKAVGATGTIIEDAGSCAASTCT